MKRHLRINHKQTLYTICLIGFIYTLQFTLPSYINSSFLGQFTREEIVGLLYMAGSIVTMIGLLCIHILLERWGNYRTAVILCIIELILLTGLAVLTDFRMIIPFFILSMAVMSLIGFTIDVFLESSSNSENVGKVRGLFMTIINTAWVLAPFLVGMLIQDNNYQIAYLTSAGFFLPLLYLFYKNLKDYKDPAYKKASDWATFKRVLRVDDFRNIFIVNIILQVFYAWMVVYSPIYLHNQLGFSWEAIGIIFTIMLLPFVLFELPLGRLADVHGEIKIMSLGFLITGVATIMLFNLNYPSVVVWSIALFVTRIGASMAETMIETYFFKRIHSKDDELLGLFRVTRPLAYLIAPIITIVGLWFTDYSTLFILLGCIVLCGLFFTSRIQDTVKDTFSPSNRQ